jgi:hypothetical protein
MADQPIDTYELGLLVNQLFGSVLRTTNAEPCLYCQCPLVMLAPWQSWMWSKLSACLDSTALVGSVEASFLRLG